MKPWVWIAGAIVFAAILVSGTLLFIKAGEHDCSRWDRTVDAADQVWNSYVNAQIAKYGPVGGSTTVAAWEENRGAIRALAEKTGKVPSSPDAVSMSVTVLLNDTGVAPGWDKRAAPFMYRPSGC